MSNRLAAEKSPYLLQHKDNPVDWWPWSEAAFDLARKLDRPILLSIGYATCHWCHVMEHESFEDTEVATLMNDSFVNIKVDREERPDIDAIYMTVCQLLTQHGGWPLTILMTPDREPFFAATYIPKDTRQGRVGMRDLIPHVDQLWKQARPKLLKDVSAIRDVLGRIMEAERQKGDLHQDLIELAYRATLSRYDPAFGGFGQAPKFPPVNALRLLMRYWRRTHSSAACDIVENTLRCMRLGGIYDQIGFGFHRYSTDQTWTVPHFEKMLYDQAMLTLAYTEAFQITGRREYERTTREIITYVLRDLTNEEGAFCAAEDADSEGREGKFYLWHEAELKDILEPPMFEAVRQFYNVHPKGNFHDEVTKQKTGENILYWKVGASPPSDEETQLLKGARRLLMAERSKRIRPLLDDKVLTDWNGLMIAALAYAGRVFEDETSLDAARRAASFIREHMQSDTGELWHRWRDGQAAIPGMLDDYAYLIWGLIELYQATFEAEYLSWALHLNGVCTTKFRDESTGVYHLSLSDDESLIVRPSQAHDNALPSGMAVMTMNLLRLARLIADPEMEKFARDVAEQFAGSLRQSPGAYYGMIAAVDYALEPTIEVVIAGDPTREDTRAMLRAAQKAYAPNAVLVFRPDDGDDLMPPITRVLPKTAAFRSRDGAPLAYVCRGFACQAPTSNVEDMVTALVPAHSSMKA